MRRAFILLNHSLTKTQKSELYNRYECEEILTPPLPLQSFWAAIHPADGLPNGNLRDLRKWVEENANAGDVLVVQGDAGASCYMAQLCRRIGVRPLYASTERTSAERQLRDGKIERLAVFDHVCFREYPQLD
jgi:hypothetical protein